MELLSVSKNQAELRLNEDDLFILVSALNEICNGINITEFQTRIGGEKTLAAALLYDMRNILDIISL